MDSFASVTVFSMMIFPLENIGNALLSWQKSFRASMTCTLPASTFHFSLSEHSRLKQLFQSMVQDQEQHQGKWILFISCIEFSTLLILIYCANYKSLFFGCLLKKNLDLPTKNHEMAPLCIILWFLGTCVFRNNSEDPYASTLLLAFGVLIIYFSRTKIDRLP